MGWPGWIYIAIQLLDALLWKVPKWQILGFLGEEKDRRTLENEYRRAIGQIIAGLAFVGTIYATSNQLAATREQLELARQGQVSDRFRLAVGQLTQESPHLAMGGIFGLEGVARGVDPAYHACTFK
jgi:hypothetical protein